MLSLIEVQCPHCGARGQIMIPPVGAIIIGPCPQCKELVVVFCGQVLPLEKAIMESGSVEDRQEHLLSVLTEFLRDRIGKIMSQPLDAEDTGMDDQFETPEEQANEQDTEGATTGEITQNELDRFVEVDLKLLDNTAYFKSVFDESR